MSYPSTRQTRRRPTREPDPDFPRRRRGARWLFAGWILYWCALALYAVWRPSYQIQCPQRMSGHHGAVHFTRSIVDWSAMALIIVPPLVMFGVWALLNGRTRERDGTL